MSSINFKRDLHAALCETKNGQNNNNNNNKVHNIIFKQTMGEEHFTRSNTDDQLRLQSASREKRKKKGTNQTK